MSLDKKASEYMKLFPSVKNLKISESSRNNKRFKATFQLDGVEKKVHFGDPSAKTYYDIGDNVKRKKFQARHSKIKLKNGNLAFKTPGTASSLSYFILW